MQTFCKLLQQQTPGRILPAGIRLYEVTFGQYYRAHSDLGISLQLPDVEDALAMIATDFAPGIDLRIETRGTVNKERHWALVVRLGWYPCDIAVLRDWVTMYNLTQAWDHIRYEELKVCPPFWPTQSPV